jgi:hypothetical protein
MASTQLAAEFMGALTPPPLGFRPRRFAFMFDFDFTRYTSVGVTLCPYSVWTAATISFALAFGIFVTTDRIASDLFFLGSVRSAFDFFAIVVLFWM